MANESKILWDATPTDMTLTSLASLADGNLWQSGELNSASPSMAWVRISYSLVFNATPIAGDYLRFWIAKGDEAAASEIWTGGIGTAVGQITAAAAKAEAIQALKTPITHFWATSHGTTFKNLFERFLFGPSWQLVLGPVGEALAASGHIIRYRYGTPQQQ